MRAAVRRLLPPDTRSVRTYELMCVYCACPWARNTCIEWILLLSPVHVHLTAQISVCCFYLSLSALCWTDCRVPKLLWLHGSARGHCWDSYCTSPLCSIVFHHSAMQMWRRTCSKACQHLTVAVVSFCFLLLNVSTVFTLHGIIFLRSFKMRFWPMGPLSKDCRHKPLFHKHWNGTPRWQRCSMCSCPVWKWKSFANLCVQGFLFTVYVLCLV